MMNAVIVTLKLAAFWTLSWLPGSLGAAFETRWCWARRSRKVGAAAAAFERTLEALDRDSLCVDLGANVGVIAERMAERAGHVHAFEPDPWSFARLKERLGDRPNVTLHNAAIGGRDGTLTLMRDPGFDANRAGASQGTSAFASLLWNHGASETFEAPVVDIRRFLRSLDRPVDLMKVDIEGGEAELLETLLEAPERLRVRTMFIETHEPQMPALRPRLKALRRRIRFLDRPAIHLDWV